MHEDRRGHTATVLDGPACHTPPLAAYCGQVLVTGGSDAKVDILNPQPGSPKDTTEIFDPETETWRYGPPMNQARTNHTATLLQDGRVLVVGPGKSAEIYDPRSGPSGAWTPVADMNFARARHTATLLPDGKVLIAGGTNIVVANPAVNGALRWDFSAAAVPIAEVFDPATGGWTQTAPMAFARSYHTANLVRGMACLPTEPTDCSRVLVAGGTVGNGEDPSMAMSAELYNPSTNSWAPTGPLNIGRQGHQSVQLNDGRVLVAGGCASPFLDQPCYDDVGDVTKQRPGRTVEIYDPAKGLWTSVSGTMSEARGGPEGDFTAAVLPGGRVLLAGGRSDPYPLSACLFIPPPLICAPHPSPGATSDLFDPTGASFAPAHPMVTARSGQRSVVLRDGGVLAIGGVVYGKDSPLVATKSAEIYGGSSAAPTDLSIGITARPDPVAVGEVLTYTIEVTNNGPPPTDQAWVTDTLPPGATYQSSPADCRYAADSRTVTCDLGGLQPGQKTTREINVKPAGPGKLSNTARVDSVNRDPDLSNNQATVETTVTGTGSGCTGGCADLSITKTASPEPAILGGNLSYTLTVGNRGQKASQAASVLDQLPPQVSYKSSSQGCVTSSQNAIVRCPIGALDPGQERSFQVNVSPKQTGSVTNTASVADDNEAEGNLSNNSSAATTEVQPTLSISDETVVEGNSGSTKMSFKVSLSASYDKPVTVDYESEDGSAKAPDDYIATSGRLVFAPGQTSQTIDIQIIGDKVPESYQTFYVNLLAPQEAGMVKSRAVGTITDDDSILSINDIRIPKKLGFQNAEFTVSLDPPTDATVSVNYATADGSATADHKDYEPTQGSLTFGPSQTSKTISVRVLVRDSEASEEDFFMNLSAPINSTIGRATGRAVIEGPPPGAPKVSHFAYLPASPLSPTQCIDLGVCGGIGIAADEHQVVATIQGGEVYSFDSSGTGRLIANVPCSACEPWPAISAGLAGFPKGQVFVSFGGSIYSIGPSGLVVPFAELPAVPSGVQGQPLRTNVGITFDRVGTFGFDMLAIAGSGQVYKINSLGVPVLVATTPRAATQTTDIDEAGTAVVAPFSFEPFGGDLLVGEGDDLTSGYAVSPSGAVRKIEGAAASSLQVIPCDMGTFAGGSLFAVGQTEIVKFPPELLERRKGSAIGIGEAGDPIYALKPNGTAAPDRGDLYSLSTREGGGVASIYRDSPVATVSNILVDEPVSGTSQALVELKLAPGAQALPVHYVIHDGAKDGATAGEDFIAGSGDFVLDDTSPHRVPITILSDDVAEPNEDFFVDFTSSNCSTFSLRATVTIKDPTSRTSPPRDERNPGASIRDSNDDTLLGGGSYASRSPSIPGSHGTTDPPPTSPIQGSQQALGAQQPLLTLSQPAVQGQAQTQAQLSIQPQTHQQAAVEPKLAAVPAAQQRDIQFQHARNPERKQEDRGPRGDHGYLASGLESAPVGSFSVTALWFLGLSLIITRPRTNSAGHSRLSTHRVTGVGKKHKQSKRRRR